MDIRNRTDNNTDFEVHARVDHANPSLPLTFTGHQPDLKSHWIQEIGQYANDSLALHEHGADDLRIDPTQVKPDTDGEELRLPQRKASYESDGIKPSEVAKNYFLTASERESYAKQHAEEQQILLAQQQSFIERKTKVAVASAQQQQKQESTTSTTQEQVVAVEKTKAEEKHIKLTRSAAIEKSEEIQEVTLEVKSTNIGAEVKSKNKSSTQVKPSTETATKKEATKSVQQIESDTQKQTIAKDPIETGKRSERSERSVVVVDDKQSASSELESSIKSIASAAAASITTMSESQSNAKLTLAADSTAANTNKIHTLENQLALKSVSDAPCDADTPHNTRPSNNNKENTAPSSNAPNQAAASRYHTVSTYNFGDRQGQPPGGPPPSQTNLNIFLVPPHLITYETSIEINVLKIPAPLPPQPPKFVKKLLVHTESLERKTRAFLSGNFEVGTTDSSLRTARQKIRSLKSTILKSDDEVKHAEDTITKAQSGDFLHIFTPPIIEKPLYEFIEIPSERSEEECSEYSDRRSERGISTEQQHENMEDYYSSKYSSRSSRRRVEGECIPFPSSCDARICRKRVTFIFVQSTSLCRCRCVVYVEVVLFALGNHLLTMTQVYRVRAECMRDCSRVKFHCDRRMDWRHFVQECSFGFCKQ